MNVVTNNNNITWSNVTVYKGKETEQAVPLETRVKEALQKSQKYGLLGVDAMNDIATQIIKKVNDIESSGISDVIGLSVNEDGSVAIKTETSSDPVEAEKRLIITKTEIMPPFSLDEMVKRKKVVELLQKISPEVREDILEMQEKQIVPRIQSKKEVE